MLWKWKFPIFEKQLILSIAFPFIDDFTLNIDKINGFLKFWPLMTFFGLHWPFWPLWPWMNFLSKNWPLLIKIKHNWLVSNNQMSKPISKCNLAFWITVNWVKSRTKDFFNTSKFKLIHCNLWRKSTDLSKEPWLLSARLWYNYEKIVLQLSFKITCTS